MSEEADENEGAEAPENDEFRFQKVGEKLAAERKEQGLDLTNIAERTRIPLRHLEAIERSDFAVLPGSTYMLGFARSYARSMGMDAAEIGADLRSELSESGHDSYQAPSQSFEPTDPARIPSKMLAWTAAAIAALLLAGYLIWRSSMFDGSTGADDLVAVADEGSEAAAADASAGATGQDAPDPSGQVMLTATDIVWVRIYDAGNKRLYEKEMRKGESFTVPQDANNPMINTGRAQAIDVTIGGKKVAPLGPADLPILDVGISASSLVARGKNDSASTTQTSNSSQ
ncbi:MAG: helix-turn-helix domain-containing protein [Sphingorhabdus sp.]